MPRPKFTKKTTGTAPAETPAASPLTSSEAVSGGAATAAAPARAAETINATEVLETKTTEMNPTMPKKTRKPEIVKTETRSNLIPINVEDEIRRLAYLLAERRGFEPGHENEDWLNAEREVMDRYHHHTAQTA